MKPVSALRLSIAATAAAYLAATPAGAQDILDRADAAVQAARADEQRANLRGTSAASVASADAAVTALTGTVEVSAIVVEGAPSVPPALFVPATEPYLARPLNGDDLRALATNVANVLRSRGYVFASAWVEPQAIAHGILRVSADEGRIDRVRFVGRELPAVARALGGLSDGQPVTAARLQRALLLAGDLPGIDVRDSRYEQQNGRGLLTVEPVRRGTESYANIDNYGSGSSGPIRFRGRLSLNDLAAGGDQLTIRTTLTPLDPRELATLGGVYSTVLDRQGTVATLSGSLTRVRPGERYRRLDLDGGSVSANIGLMRPLVRTVEANLWASADLSLRDSEQERSAVLLRDDRVASLALGLSGYALVKGGWLSGRVTFRQGLDILGATEAGDPLASRRDGDGVFSKAEAYVEWSVPVVPRVSIRLAAEGQLASRPLLSSEEFGIGGPRFGRAFEFSERRGDQGAAGLVELQYRVPGKFGPVDDVEIYGFVDGGTVDNLRGRSGGDLASAGGGVRFDLGRVFDAEFELAAPLDETRFETGNKNPRLSFSISARF